jgi:hypothetical protein
MPGQSKAEDISRLPQDLALYKQRKAKLCVLMEKVSA